MTQPRSATTTADDEREWQAQFRRDVFPAEMAAVRDRRLAHAAALAGSPLPTEPSPVDPAERPSTRHGLVGLALSGGGMRSAAFNLGVLQALHRAGLLGAVDYLSTVSGGGWIGAALQSLLREPGAPFPFAPESGVPTESRVVSYLRGRSNALLPSGLRGGVFLAASMIRGQLVTVALLLPAALLLAIVTAPLVLAYLRTADVADLRGLPWTWFTRHARPALAAVGAWMLVGFVYTLVFRPGPRARFRLERSNSILLGAALAFFALELQPFIIVRWARFVFNADDDAPSFGRYAPQLAALALSTLSFGPLAAMLPRVARPLALGLAFVVSVATPYLFFVHRSAVVIRTALDSGFDYAPMTDVALPVALLVFLLIGSFDTNDVSLHSIFRDRIARTFILRRRPADRAVEPYGQSEPYEDLRLSELNRPGSTAPYALINASLNLQATTDRSRSGRQGDFFVFSARHVGSDRTGYCSTEALEAVVPGMTLATAVAVSAAAASPNMGTYTLRALVVLMTFLNLRLGFWLPHPGRLRRWLPTDWASRSAQWRSLAMWKWYPAVRYFFRELASRIDDRGQHVYLTDGGHLENTGAYELLRRRCKVIIVSDAEEDRFVRFGGLAALLRYARLDLQTRIDLDLGDLRCNEDGTSRRHAALGLITYPALDDGTPEEHGRLVYLKSSLTADEDELIREYRSRFGDFPHQSTSDQLFDEAQFEAYRSLGTHVVEGVVARAAVGSDDLVASWIDDLHARLSRDASVEPAFAQMRDELEEVEAMLQEAALAPYFAELYPELAAPTVADVAVIAPPPERLFTVVTRQVHLMVTVFNELGLDVPGAYVVARHQGWINTFRRWSAAPTFRRYWLVLVHAESAAFLQFCELALGLTVGVAWREADAATVRAEGDWTTRLCDAASVGERLYLGRLTVCGVDGPTAYAARVDGTTVPGGCVRTGYEGALEQRAQAALDRALVTAP